MYVEENLFVLEALTLFRDPRELQDRNRGVKILEELARHYSMEHIFIIDAQMTDKQSALTVKRLLEIAARSGYHHHILDWGKRMIDGKKMKRNTRKGKCWMEIAADAGYQNASFELGKRLIEGKGIKRDEQEGEKWLEKAAIAGYKDAILTLIKRLIGKNGSKKIVPFKHQWLEQVVLSDPTLVRYNDSQLFIHTVYNMVCQGMSEMSNALSEVGESAPIDRQETTVIVPAEGRRVYSESQQMYQVGLRLDRAGRLKLQQWIKENEQQAENLTVVNENETEGLESEEQVALARTRYSSNLYELARKLINGIGMDKHPERGKKRLEQAAHAGNQNAIMELGKRLIDGNGIAQDTEEGKRWLEEGARRGIYDVSLELGKRLIDGNGINQDAEQGKRWLEQASRAGHQNSILELSKRLFEGKGMAQDPLQAKKWLELGAKAGNKDVIFKLGRILIEGKGVLRDRQQGEKWLQQIVEAGDIQAMYILGKSLITGERSEADYQEGKRLLETAAQDGYVPAMRELGRQLIMGKKMDKHPVVGRRWIAKANVSPTPVNNTQNGVIANLLQVAYTRQPHRGCMYAHCTQRTTWLDELMRSQQIRYAIVNQLTNTYQILKYRYFQHRHNIMLNKKEIYLLLYNQKVTKVPDKPISTLLSQAQFQATDHAEKRWNERVGPYQTFKELRVLLQLLLEADRIAFFPSRFGVIDNEIVFAYRLEKSGRLVVTTFLGRISLKPSMINEELVKGNTSRYRSRLSLKVNKNLIEKQTLPVMPTEIFHLQSDKGVKYILLEYEYIENNEYRTLLHYREMNNHAIWKKIDCSRSYQPSEQKIDKSLLKLLFYKGYEEFVMTYLAYHFPDKLIDRLSEPYEQETL